MTELELAAPVLGGVLKVTLIFSVAHSDLQGEVGIWA